MSRREARQSWTTAVAVAAVVVLQRWAAVVVEAAAWEVAPERNDGLADAAAAAGVVLCWAVRWNRRLDRRVHVRGLGLSTRRLHPCHGLCHDPTHSLARGLDPLAVRQRRLGADLPPPATRRGATASARRLALAGSR
mmetsp:Transcript_8766/g.27963  ORF Transcript_8766/g.27963 Transcript_8766/m.27963 type:complete len:137 (+) Transcript_8766:180-590(+)